MVTLHSKTPIPSVTYSAQGLHTIQWLDSDGVVTVVNCWQYTDYTITFDQLSSHRAAGSG